MRCVEEGVKVEVIHNASIVSAMGCCGLQVYRFGEIVSVPFFTDNWRPYSFYDKIKGNATRGLHTLALLDIKVKEPTLESLARGKPVYMPPRYMSTKVAAEQLIEAAEKQDGEQSCYNGETKCFGLARIATQTQLVISGSLKEFAEVIEMGPPLHSLVLCGELHDIEQTMYEHFHYSKHTDKLQQYADEAKKVEDGEQEEKKE